MRILKDTRKRNRAFVVMPDGNKIHYGTLNSCYKFIVYMKGVAEHGSGKMDK